MSEKIYVLEDLNPVELYGTADSLLDLLRSKFPQLKIVARDQVMRLTGIHEEILRFTNTIELLKEYHHRFGNITPQAIERLTGGEEAFISTDEQQDDVLVHGKNGLIVKARSVNQQRMVESSTKNDLLFAIGPAGSGKTYTAVALAVRALKNKEIKKIILTRPAVEAGEKLGFLPGDVREKLDPYLQPLYDALRDMIPGEKLNGYMEDGTIQIAPLAFMRGRTLDNAFAILDEAQNATNNQLKMFLTRMGKNARFIVTGDVTQIDLPRNVPSGLLRATRILKDIPGIDFIFLDERDIVRHPIVIRVVEAYSKSEKEVADENLNNNSNDI
ncbi:MAG: PhoH family protein [Bacteroidota bacterium]